MIITKFYLLPFMKIIAICVFINITCSSIKSKTLQTDNNTENSISNKILSLAARAPSGHNTQPWTVRIDSDTEWTIGWSRERSLPAVDPDNRELMLGIGAFCEAITAAANSFGLEAKITVIAKSNFDAELVKIHFSKSESIIDMTEALNKRRTIRKGLLGTEINPDARAKIISGIKSRAYFFDRGTDKAKIIEKAELESNRAQAYRKEAQIELADWIRWSDKDAEHLKNGLTPGSMEINGLAGWYVKHFYNRDKVLTKEFSEQSIDLISEFLSSYGAWIVIETPNGTPEQLITAGGDFLRMGLNSFGSKIALHPMTQPLEEKGFNMALRELLGIKGDIQFIVRAGYVKDYAGPVSNRMPVELILK